MRSGRYLGVALVLAALALFLAGREYTWTQTTRTREMLPVRPAAAAPSTDPRSCKPAPPLQVEAETAGANDLWTLRLRSDDLDRDVIVWMGTGAERREVWRGRLPVNMERRVDVSYAAPAGAAQVWVEVEPAQAAGNDPIFRGVAVAPVPGRARAGLSAAPPGAPPGQLRVDPQTGERVLEFPAQVQAAERGDSGSKR